MKDSIRAEMEQLIAAEDVAERYHLATTAVREELTRALRWPPMNSAHEGYAVLAEEVEELLEHDPPAPDELLKPISRLWASVKVRQGERNIPEMTYEAVQVAAMALRFIIDVCTATVAAK